MKRYFFYDYDYITNEDLVFGREAYEKLLEFCFLNSETVSFMFDSTDIVFANWLEQFRVPYPENVVKKSEFELHKACSDKYRFYRACPELHQWMLEAVGNIFEWIDGWGFKNPENPCFFRQDGSALFFSTIHEGELVLQVNEDENVDHILSKAKWTTTQSLIKVGESYKILGMLNEANPQEVQLEGLRLARITDELSGFICPPAPAAIWEKCANILCEKSDEVLEPYLEQLLERWLTDFTRPGAHVIWNRLKQFPGSKLKQPFMKSVTYIATATWFDDQSRLKRLRCLRELLEYQALRDELPIDFLKMLQKYC